ncbi:protein fuzzy homolog [Folsomia candida]|uniref:protein fuzzy homolog n=1 Tax=Folsomia candida TaxID=158441 RepID=UPI001604DBEC|nr:protein fuzzy homolog [Folsomia candida]
MTGYLICICFESGVPIFARKIGDVSPISWPLAASLNGLKVFGKANRVELISSITESSRVVWKDFHDRLALIFAGTDDSITDFHVEHVLVNVFSVLVLSVGLDEIVRTKSVDKLKKEFRMCYPVIDLILQGLKPNDRTLYFGDLTGCADVALQMDPPNNQVNFQTVLDNLMESIGFNYGCLIANGILIGCTEDWWTLSGTEMCLITFTASLISDPVTDAAIFLPSSSPNLAYRFVTFKVVENVRLCVLCGQEPTLPTIEKEIAKLKKNFSEQLSLFQNRLTPFCRYSRFFNIGKSISGFLLVCLDRRRCTFSVFPERSNEQMNTGHKLDLLRTFYRNTVGSIFPWSCAAPPMFVSPPIHLHHGSKHVGPTVHKASEAYWTSEYHKCHAMTFAIFQLFVIYEPDIPMLLMRQTTRKLLQELVKEKVMR